MATNRNEPLFTRFPINKFPLTRFWSITHSGFIQDLTYTFGSDVSATGWKRGTNDTRKAYDFTYDGLHRLKTAVYNEGGGTNNHYSENVNGYDRNGNITSLSRRGRTGAATWGVIDSLTISRTGNQLTSVTDVGVSAYSGDFNTSSTTSTYDANGAMISDTGRGISSITWNEINLPKTVTFTNGSTIDYYYAADGTKLQEIRTVSGTAMKIDWCGDLVIEKVGSGTRTAKRLRLDGAYVDLTQTTPVPRHFVRDHLGSTRAVVSDLGTVLETDDFYPLGGPLPTTTTIQPEKYQGKEWNTAASFNVYDFGARLYDPSLGRWISQDPMAERSFDISPYSFCLGNPLSLIDPNGLSTYTVNGEEFTIDDGDESFRMEVTQKDFNKLQKLFEKDILKYARFREKLSMTNEYTFTSVEPSKDGGDILDGAVITVQQKPGTSYMQNQEQGISSNLILSFLSSLSGESVAGRINVGDNGVLYFRHNNGFIFNGNQYVSVQNLYKALKGLSSAANIANIMSTNAYALLVSSQMDPVSAQLYPTSVFWGSMAGVCMSQLAGELGVSIGLLVGPEGAVVGGIAGSMIGGGFGSSFVENIVSGRWF